MVAIETHYLGPTSHRGSRIVAETANGQRLVVSCQYGDDDHRRAAEMLMDKMGWTGRLIMGATKAGYVFVFADR